MIEKAAPKIPYVVQIHTSLATYIKSWLELALVLLFSGETMYAAYLGLHYGIPSMVRVLLHSGQAAACILFSISFFSIIKLIFDMWKKFEKSNVNIVIISIRTIALIAAMIAAAAGTIKGPWALFALIASMSEGISPFTGELFPAGGDLIAKAVKNCDGYFDITCWNDVLEANPLLAAPYTGVIIHYVILFIVSMLNSDILGFVKPKPTAATGVGRGGSPRKTPSGTSNSGSSRRSGNSGNSESGNSAGNSKPRRDPPGV